MKFLAAHWETILLIGGTVWMAAVNALPEPAGSGSRIYTWFYAFAHGLKLDIGESVSAAKMAMK